MTAICGSHYRNPLNDYVGKKHHHQNRFRPRQSTRSAFYKPGLQDYDNKRQEQLLPLQSPSPSQHSQHSHSQHSHQEPERRQSVSQSPIQPEGHWGFRPSALQYEDYGRGDMSVSEIVDCYIRDNERAEKEGVSIPPRPTLSDRRRKKNTSYRNNNNNNNNNHSAKLRGVRDALFSAASSSLLSIGEPPTGNNHKDMAESVSEFSSSSSSCELRCLQWNIQAFSSPKDERNMHTITAGIIRSICETDSDVLVLNEILWREETTAPDGDGNSGCTRCHGGYFHCESTKRSIRSSRALLEEVLRLRGYHYSRVADHGDTPTMIATRKKVLESKEVVLSDNRSALCLLLETSTASSASSSCCWVVGTHLDAFDAERRRSEIRTLLNEASRQQQHRHQRHQRHGHGPGRRSFPVLIAGDFNQQRSRDYTPTEWKRVSASADLRGVPRDDGVADILERGGFRCVLDDVRSSLSPSPPRDESSSRSPRSRQQQRQQHTVACNWNQTQPPPSTHWSGTTIDYTYYHNNNNSKKNTDQDGAASSESEYQKTTLAPHGVYVGPAGFSDHRMTVTDWILTTTDTSRKPGGSPPSRDTLHPKHIDKSFFFHHLPEGRHDSWLYNKQSTPLLPTKQRERERASTNNNNNNNV